jgi:hypothetical protein
MEFPQPAIAARAFKQPDSPCLGTYHCSQLCHSMHRADPSVAVPASRKSIYPPCGVCHLTGNRDDDTYTDGAPAGLSLARYAVHTAERACVAVGACSLARAAAGALAIALRDVAAVRACKLGLGQICI